MFALPHRTVLADILLTLSHLRRGSRCIIILLDRYIVQVDRPANLTASNVAKPTEHSQIPRKERLSE
jgi:hypothetical protein